jgi:hypothetical protein
VRTGVPMRKPLSFSTSTANTADFMLKCRLSNAPGAEFVGVAGRAHGDLSMW